VTRFKLEDHESLLDRDPESGHGRLAALASPARRSKRVKVDIVNAEGTGSWWRIKSCPKAPTGKGKGNGKAARPLLVRTPPFESAASRKKPKAIKLALEKPHRAPAHWREMYDAIKEMRSRFPAPDV